MPTNQLLNVLCMIESCISQQFDIIDISQDKIIHKLV